MKLFDKIFKKKKKPDASSDELFNQLWQQLVPEGGQAETVQGELIRSVGRITDEFLRNGCANWDSGFEIMSEFLLSHLTDGTFGEMTTYKIKADIDGFQSYSRGEDIQYDFEGACDRLIEATVVWCQKHPELVQRTSNPELKR